MAFRKHVATGVIALGAAAGLLVSITAFASRESGISNTAGAMIVIASCAAIFLAALELISWPRMWGWLRGLLMFLLFLGILGTGLAAFFLSSFWLLLCVFVCFVGWLMAVLSPSRAARKARHGAKRRAVVS